MSVNLEREINRSREDIQRIEAKLSRLEATLLLVKAVKNNDLEAAKNTMKSTNVDVNYMVTAENGKEERLLEKVN